MCWIRGGKVDPDVALWNLIALLSVIEYKVSDTYLIVVEIPG